MCTRCISTCCYYFHSADEETKTQAGDAQGHKVSHYWSYSSNLGLPHMIIKLKKYFGPKMRKESDTR